MTSHFLCFQCVCPSRVPGSATNPEYFYELDLLNCYEPFLNSTDPLRPNIVFVLNWTSPDSNNTALCIAALGYTGDVLLSLCPKSFYNSTEDGLQVLNASTMAPEFYTLLGSYTNPAVETIGDDNCPYRHSPILSY
jgi:hypothetical protein